MKPACLAGALVVALSSFAIAQVATLQIKIMEGDAITHVAGSRNTRPLIVQITDDDGQAVSGAAVSFRLPDDGPGGLFANGLRTEVAISDAGGRATVRRMQLNHTPGDFQIRITASKEQARAGTLARQFIAGPEQTPGRALRSKAKSGRKWMVVALMAAGLAGGVSVGVAMRPAAAVAAAHPAPPAPALTIGPPVVTVGRP
jgi:hypothetical protein